MGRNRIDEKEKKIKVSIRLKRKYLEHLRENNVNISELINQLVENYLKLK